MDNPKIIISSTALLRQLLLQPTSRDLHFNWTPEKTPKAILIGAYGVPVETKDFSPFTMTGKQVRSLCNVLRELEEQPIVFEWDGSWAILQRVVIS